MRRTPVLPSGWTPLGLVKHLGFAERHWFQRVATGSAGELPWTGLPGEEGGRKPLTTGLPADVVFGFYRDQCECANAIVAATPLSASPLGRHPGDPGGEICDLRRFILRMIEETARHAGHLDVARELADNRTGHGLYAGAGSGHPRDMDTGGLSGCGLRAAVDVHRLSRGGAQAAAVLIPMPPSRTRWPNALRWSPGCEHTAMVARVPAYRPGEFYLRELPPVRTVLEDLTGLDLLVVDGYADLDPAVGPVSVPTCTEFGVPVIGVAKSRFRLQGTLTSDRRMQGLTTLQPGLHRTPIRTV